MLSRVNHNLFNQFPVVWHLEYVQIGCVFFLKKKNPGIKPLLNSLHFEHFSIKSSKYIITFK